MFRGHFGRRFVATGNGSSKPANAYGQISKAISGIHRLTCSDTLRLVQPISVSQEQVCGFCGTHADHPIISRHKDHGTSYHRCLSCKSIFLYPLPPEEQNAEFSGKEAEETLLQSDEERVRYFGERLDLVREAVPSTPGPVRMLEIGCSTGLLLSLARRHGWNVTGVEMSPELAEAARHRNPGVTVLQEDFLKVSADRLPAEVEAVIALDVLEHVLSPGSFLQKCHALLAPGGVLLLQTPNASSLRSRLHGEKWNMLIPEYHFHLPAPEALQHALERCGFEVRLLRTESGTGREHGLHQIVKNTMAKILRQFKLGNALLALAVKK